MREAGLMPGFCIRPSEYTIAEHSRRKTVGFLCPQNAVTKQVPQDRKASCPRRGAPPWRNVTSATGERLYRFSAAAPAVRQEKGRRLRCGALPQRDVTSYIGRRLCRLPPQPLRLSKESVEDTRKARPEGRTLIRGTTLLRKRQVCLNSAITGASRTRLKGYRYPVHRMLCEATFPRWVAQAGFQPVTRSLLPPRNRVLLSICELMGLSHEFYAFFSSFFTTT